MDRTLDLLEGFDDHDLGRQLSPLMSPLVWDLAHIGHYEELWLLRNLAGAPTDRSALRRRVRRVQAPAPRPAESPHPRPARRPRAISPACASASSTDWRTRRSTVTPTRCSRTGFVYGMVIQHEHQHDETMLATIQLMEQPALDPTLVEPSGAVGVASCGLHRRGRCCPAARSSWAPTPSRGRTTTSAPPTRSTSRRSASTAPR